MAEDKGKAFHYVKKLAEEARAENVAKLIKSSRKIPEDKLYLTFPWPKSLSKPKVPLGYGLKGGWARHGLTKVIGTPFFLTTPRDTDLVVFVESPKSELKKVSRKIMKEDAERGHFAEEVKSLKDYFLSRDFTLNQVLVRGRTIYCTPACIIALERGMVVPVKELDENLILRGLRFLVEGGSESESSVFLDSIKGAKVSEFLYNLNIEKLKARGKRQVERFQEISKNLKLKIYK